MRQISSVSRPVFSNARQIRCPAVLVSSSENSLHRRKIRAGATKIKEYQCRPLDHSRSGIFSRKQYRAMQLIMPDRQAVSSTFHLISRFSDRQRPAIMPSTNTVSRETATKAQSSRKEISSRSVNSSRPVSRRLVPIRLNRAGVSR